MSLVTAKVLSKELGIKELTRARLYQMARDGLIPHIRLGRSVRFDRARVNEWLANGGTALPGGWRRVPLASSAG
jgi:excisionase family DNA binding protein